MTKRNQASIPTRASLLLRLKDLEDRASWQTFFDTYWNLIYGVARQSELNDAEAQDVVSEVMISAAKHLPQFKYDPAKGSFKSWLLRMTRWRIVTVVRKRSPQGMERYAGRDGEPGEDMIDSIPDPNIVPEEIWEIEWKENLMAAATARVRHGIDPEKYQIFDFYAHKGWPAPRVADHFKIHVDQVYVIKSRILGMIKDEVARLEREMT